MHYDCILGKRISDAKVKQLRITGYYPSGRRRKRAKKRTSIPLPSNWNEIRESVIGRDKVCQECGEVQWLGVHHKDLNRLNNELDNLVLLCWSCHMEKHHDKV